MNGRVLSCLALAAATALAACQPAPETPAPEPLAGVEVSSAGVELGTLPTLFTVVANDDERFELDVPSLPGSHAWIALSDVHEGGLNIVEAVKQELAAYDALPEGRSFGQTQLVAPIGLTYMTRGRFPGDDGMVEELKALVAHPWGNRLLTVGYRYPAGDDTAERGGHLMELLGELEALPASDEEAPAE